MSITSTTSIDDVTLRAADNGFILSYTQRIKSINPSMNTDYDYKQEVFEDGEKAITRMTELLGYVKKESKSVDEQPKIMG